MYGGSSPRTSEHAPTTQPEGAAPADDPGASLQPEPELLSLDSEDEGTVSSATTVSANAAKRAAELKLEAAQARERLAKAQIEAAEAQLEAELAQAAAARTSSNRSKNSGRKSVGKATSEVPINELS